MSVDGPPSPFPRRLLDVGAWKSKAEELLDVAALLEPAIQVADDGIGLPDPSRIVHLSAAYFMLISFAVENLLKGALVARRPDQYEKLRDARRPFPLATHDLLGIAESLGLTLSTAEMSLLTRLRHCATWSGRYPAPLKPEDFPILEDSDATAIVSPDDVPRIRELLRRLRAELFGENEGPETSVASPLY